MAKERAQNLEALNRQLTQAYMRGLWARELPERGEPSPFGVSHVWKWSDIRDGLESAGELVSLDRFGVRRNIGLVNPSLMERGAFASPTMSMGFQLVKPGEMALAHRHTASAIRFIVEGKVGAYTVVNGEKCTMERGDLILTPNWFWHDHHNETDKPVIWIDGLDAPLTMSLRTGFTEPYDDPKGQPVSSSIDSAVRKPAGLARPGHLPTRLVYKWPETLSALEGIDEADKSPNDGRCLEYRNEAYGGHTLKTLTCWIQMLEGGEETLLHRHTYTHLYHVFEGQGVSEVEGKELTWEKGDCFVVPNWTWHRHRNTDATTPTILFSMNDLPLQEALGLYREESAT
jgi:gentisate 1,2-dioxygenase